VNSGSTISPILMTYDEPFSRMFQTIRGKTYSAVYTRYSDDNGVSWTSWVRDDATKNEIGIVDVTTAVWE
jgi:hypothetical protein